MLFTPAVICLLVLTIDLLGAEEKHGLKAEAMRELGNIQYSVRNTKCVNDISLSLFNYLTNCCSFYPALFIIACNLYISYVCPYLSYVH